GPVLATMTFRTPQEAVELANNTVYGLAACVWSESINVSLHVAAQLKAGVVWVNCTNLFDAACGFGGYRESGFGREGGREGLVEYVRRVPRSGFRVPRSALRVSESGPTPTGETYLDAQPGMQPAERGTRNAEPGTLIDRTPKLYI